ncbi:MAG: hypothetical protein IJZ16_10175 [Clostridia bacterium]|nr:hypothetical protein [Clostridia bacterium]
MKKFTKILAVALAVLMLMMTSVTAFADRPYLPLGEAVYVEQYGGDYDEFNFCSEEGGYYLIHTASLEDWMDPSIYVFYYDDVDGEVYVAYSDDSLFGNFDSEVEFYAEPGIVYYIRFSNYNGEEDNVIYDVCIEEWEEGLHYYCHDYDGDACCDVCGYDYCDHSCHDGGFFWRITNFFNRLFRINMFCECGNYHWGAQ